MHFGLDDQCSFERLHKNTKYSIGIPLSSDHLPSDEIAMRKAIEASKIRDHLSNERTFLAWIRTGISLIGLGFVVARLGVFLREIAGQANVGVTRSLVLGIILIVLGAAMNVFALRNYFKTYKQIETDTFQPPSNELIAFAAATVGMAIVAVILLFTI